MSDMPPPSAAPDLTSFTNYEYEFDLNGDSSGARLIALSGKSKRVLEIGAGSGAIARPLVEVNNCEVVALEINPVSVEKLKAFCKSVYSVDLNVRNWPSALAAEGKFDVVIAGDVLEHLYDPWSVLKDMKGLLNDDGYILLSLPHAGYRGMLACLAQEDFAYGEWGLLDKTHIRFFGVHNIQALHDNAGLAIEDARFVVRDPEEVEFGGRWSALPDSAKRAFSRNKFSSVYQIVTKAAPAERVAEPLLLIGAEPPPTKSAARAMAEEKAKQGQIKLIAFFLTQYHPIAENDEWWGRGFTEWTNVTKAKPLFPGHYQPQLPTELGFYDLRLRQSRRDQIDLAKNYGIDGFCYHYYWFSGRRLLNAPLDDMLSDPESDMPFCVCWANENWTRRWDAAEHEILIAQQYRTNDDLEFIKELAPLFKDKRYIHVDGAPFFIVYRPQHLPDAKKSVVVWRAYCESIGIPEIHVACAFTHGNWDYKQFGFDSGVEFPPHNMVKASLSPEMTFHSEFDGYVFDMADVAELYLDRKYSDENEGFRGVFPSWDNTARRGPIASVGLNGTPRNYEYWLSQAIAKTREDFPGQDRMVFINAWNEWAEGCHLEPCGEFGRQFLDATLTAKNRMSRETGFADRGIPAFALAPRPIEETALAVIPQPEFVEETASVVIAQLEFVEETRSVVAQPLDPVVEASFGGLAPIAPSKKYSPFGIFIRKKVRNPIRAALRRAAGRPPKPDRPYVERDRPLREISRSNDEIDEWTSCHGLSQEIRKLEDLHGHLTPDHKQALLQRETLAAERGELIEQRDEMMAQRDEMMAQRDEMMAQRDEMMAQQDGLKSQYAKLSLRCSAYVAQIASLSSVVVERDRIAGKLAAAINGSEAGVASSTMLETRLSNSRARYLDLIESTLIGSIYDDPPLPTFGKTKFDSDIRSRGLDWPKSAYSMIGAARMRNFRVLLERVIIGNIPGDIVETGVWRGGAGILARAVLKAHEVTDRKVILADSFEGLPHPDGDKYPADQNSNFHEFPELAVSLEQVQANFDRFGLLDEQVVLVKGWFKDTMRTLPTDQIAVLRLDGDMYQSTIDPLNHLFDRISPGGWIIVDDYDVVKACKAAVTDFLVERSLKVDIIPIDGVGVYFQKNS